MAGNAVGLAAVLLVLIGTVLVFLVGRMVRRVVINPWETGAVMIDGGFDRLLSPGPHRLWGPKARVEVLRIPSTVQYLSLGTFDAVTADKLPIRLNATIAYRIVDPMLALQQPLHQSYRPALTLAVSSAVVALASARDLEPLMRREDDPDAALLAAVSNVVEGIEIEQAALASVTLPPELRRLMVEVERARLEGLAALERARGEQAALRSLANAARLLKDNPELAHLRLLQTVSTAKAATIVIGDAGPRVTP